MGERLFYIVELEFKSVGMARFHVSTVNQIISEHPDLVSRVRDSPYLFGCYLQVKFTDDSARNDFYKIARDKCNPMNYRYFEREEKEHKPFLGRHSGD
jgi:hypothetical protein